MDKMVARSLFKFSILYLMLLCLAMVIDSFPIIQTLSLKLMSDWPL